MKIDIVTIFPDMLSNMLAFGIYRRAVEAGVTIGVHNLRLWAGKHGAVDDRPFGGGPGMVMMIAPMYKAVSELKSKDSTVVLTSPRGKKLTSSMAVELSKLKHVIFLCGHYEGVDERVRQHVADMDISIGDYVLSGGELPVMVIVDAVLRHVPGVLGNPDSLREESFEGGIEKEYPQYTRPEVFEGWPVPDVLMSGDHGKVHRWRRDHSNT